jgi:hypothetical protein
MTDVELLIARLQAATGPERTLDFQIRRWLKGDGFVAIITWWTAHDNVRWMDGTDTNERGCPYFTRSLDAALTLVPDDCWYLIGCGRVRPEEPLYGAQIMRPLADRPIIGEGEHPASQAIALCIAALRARQVASAKEDDAP